MQPIFTFCSASHGILYSRQQLLMLAVKSSHNQHSEYWAAGSQITTYSTPRSLKAGQGIEPANLGEWQIYGNNGSTPNDTDQRSNLQDLIATRNGRVSSWNCRSFRMAKANESRPGTYYSQPLPQYLQGKDLHSWQGSGSEAESFAWARRCELQWFESLMSTFRWEMAFFLLQSGCGQFRPRQLCSPGTGVASGRVCKELHACSGNGDSSMTTDPLLNLDRQAN